MDCPCAPLNRSEVGLTTERMATELDAGLCGVGLNLVIGDSIERRVG